MLPLISSIILLFLLAPSTSRELQVRGQRTPRDAEQDSIKVLISEGCNSQGDSSDVNQGGKAIDLTPGSPLVLTHKIKLVPSGSGSGSCGCEADFSALRERLERLEKEVSNLREKCGGTEGGCCTSESKGAGCTIKPGTEECPNECSDQGRCVDGKCVCFPGYGGPDCSRSSCPGNCNDNGRCVNGECACDPGFSGLDCSQTTCPDSCSNRGRCVNGSCVCDSGYTGPSCSEESCPGNCNKRGRCVNGQCVCNPGFLGPDCTKRTCPDNCNNHGRCVSGKCVCYSGFKGPDCSETTCPGNCNNKGRCINGQCVCNDGFTGADCSGKSCPNDCKNRGRCVDGKCFCNSGFTGPDCSEISCPGNCNNRGRCVNGQCICNNGYAGEDCSMKACPNNCNNRGRCINGQCVCNDGFTGADCNERSCPNNCKNRGICVNGKCVCDSGFTGADCHQIACPGNCNNRGRCINGQCVCDDGFTGADCSIKACPNNCNNRGRCINGQCVCDDGFTGADCSIKACPNNCNNRGRCINGQCTCNEGFTGADCSAKTCPSNCKDRGRCVNGKCVCDSGFTGADCSEIACLTNCNNRGRCINGQCVCNDGFTGTDCSEKACPNNCNNKGRCVNGKCVCDVGFAGPDCAAKGCPNNCNNKGRCIRGKCICRRGFTGPDCSQCQEGMTGTNCNIAMTAVSQLNARDVTESSATLVWTPPPVQYETYYITFTSQKESDQQITTQVEGSLTTFTQMGLAAGQEYSARIVGEIDGRKGAESTTEFMTLISGPTNLQVVKTTSTSTVVQWEPSQGQVDRYRLTTTPNDGAGRSQEMIIPPGQTSAHIQQLEAGRLYDIILVAEKGPVLSQPAATQVVPGNTFSRVTAEDLTVQVTEAPRQDVGSTDQDLSPTAKVQVFDQQGGSNADPVKVRESSVTVIARTKPLVGTMVARNGTRPRIAGRPTKVPSSFRFNATRVVPGERIFVPGLKQKIPMVTKRKEQIEINKSNTDVQTSRESVTDQSEEISSFEKRDDNNPAVMTGSETNRQRSSEEPTPAIGSKTQPDVGFAKPESDMDSESLRISGKIQIQEMKCVNKTKVTNVGLPPEDGGNECNEDETGLQGSSLGSDSSEVSPDGETGLDYEPDPLHKLITDTFDDMNITTISVHLSKPNFSVDAEKVRAHILKGLKPLSSFSSSSSNSQLSSRSSAAAKPPSLLTYLISSSSSPSSLQTPSSSPPSSLSLLSPSLSSSSSDELDSRGTNELDSFTENHEFISRPHPNTELLQNKTHQDLRIPHKSNFHLSHTTKKETEENVPVKDTSSDKDAKPTSSTPVIEQSQRTIQRGRGRFPVRRPPLRGSYPRQRFPHFQNRTRPTLELLTRPSQPINSQTDTQKKQVFPTELPNMSSSFTKDSHPSASLDKGNEGILGKELSTTSLSSEFHQTTRGRGVPSFHRPNLRQPQLHGESFQNKTLTNLRQRQYPQRGPMRRFLPTRKQNVDNFTAGSQRNKLGKDGSHQSPEIQPGNQNVPRSFRGLLTNQSGEQGNDKLTQRTTIDGLKTPVRKQTQELDKGDNSLTEVESVTDSGSLIKRVQPGRNGASTQGSPSTKPQFRPSRPVTVPKRQPPSGAVTPKHHDTHSIGGRQKEELPKTNHTMKRLIDSGTEQTKGMVPSVSSSGVLREPLDFVGVTNQTSDGFTLTRESPDVKYKNFPDRRTETDKHKELQQKENTQKEEDQQTKEFIAENGSNNHNRVPEKFVTQGPISTAAKSTSSGVSKNILPGSAGSSQFEHLLPQTDYTLTLLGKGPGLLSRLQKLVISTGPEPPTSIVFSKVTENSVTVSWTKPKSPVSGFKVTYTHADDGEPVSVSVGSEDATLDLSRLSPGSSYEVNIISTLGLDESDPIKDFVMTLPDPPTDLKAVNVTDTKALLLWRPALAAVDKYAIVYGAGTGSELRITVSGNAAEQQLSGLEESTTYTVTITSQLGSLESSPTRTSFTTSGSVQDNGETRDLQAKNVTPRTALITWTPSSKPVDGFILVYQTEGQGPQEINVSPNVTQYKLTRLYPGSLYNVDLRTVRGARLVANTFTKFTTGKLRFPFPTDCSQELLNGILTSDVVEIFPQGKFGKSVMVYCDMETDGGGWTVFQRRKDGSVDFYRGWSDYVKGFGDLGGEFWLGLEKLHNLTVTMKMNLRVDLRDRGEAVFAQYSTFNVAKRNYKLTVGGYRGTAGDSLSYHNNCIFSTKDRDPMPGITRCAISYQGGWWYRNCHEANLNGLYGIDFKHQGVIWKSWKGEDQSIQFTEMKMRPAAFRTPSRG